MSRLGPSDRVLVRAPSHLGDFVMAEPALRALYEEREEAGSAAGLAFAAPGRLLALLDGRFPAAQRLPTEDPPRPGWGTRDAVIFLDGSWRSAWTALRAGIPLRAGFASGGRSLVLTHAFTPARERGETPLGIGRAGSFPRRLPRPFPAACREIVGWLGVSVRDPRPRLLVDSAARSRAEELLVKAGLPAGE
ncbi:MAG: hypothetical protein FJ029_03495, partial [Actinobacteria bacterium]|nr:hypothetical protein [Actinomycetota bacterium]